MKKWTIYMAFLMCIVMLLSCGRVGYGDRAYRDGDESVKSYNDTEWLNDIHTIENLPSVDFDVQYIRAGSKKELSAYPAVKIIRSANEMSRYLKNETHMSEELVSACEKYNADYFKEQILIIVLLEEGSGSVRHEVEKVGSDNTHAVIQIKSIAPEVGTCDMAWWHILIEPEAGVQIADEEDVTVFLGGRNATENYTVASHSKGFANISVTLMDGWEYDIEDEADTNEFAINIYPAGLIYPAGHAGNKIRIAYFNGFGVCGTGFALAQEQIMLGRYEAWMGTYDNRSVWDFISLQGLPGDYAILNEGGEKWWEEYGEEAMQILATLKVADGYVSASEAIKIACDKLQMDYDEVNTSYNAVSGIWTVTMTTKSGDDHETMKVTVDVYGNINDMTTVD